MSITIITNTSFLSLRTPISPRQEKEPKHSTFKYKKENDPTQSATSKTSPQTCTSTLLLDPLYLISRARYSIATKIQRTRWWFISVFS